MTHVSRWGINNLHHDHLHHLSHFENIMDALTKFSGQCHFNVMIARLFGHQIEPEQYDNYVNVGINLILIVMVH